MSRSIAAAAAAVVSASASLAGAAECEGHNARVYAEPVILNKAEDGTTTMLSHSTGTTTTISPADMVGSSFQHCVGIVTYGPSTPLEGAGHCYNYAPDGEIWTISWKIEGESRTWEFVSGTGRFSDWTGNKGTFESGPGISNGLRMGSWKGVCG